MRVQCFVHSFSPLVCMRNFTWMSSEVSLRNLLFTAPLSFHLCFTGSAQVLHFWWPFFISQRIHCKLSTWIRFVLFLINRIFLSNRIAFHFYASWSYQQWFNGWLKEREGWVEEGGGKRKAKEHWEWDRLGIQTRILFQLRFYVYFAICFDFIHFFICQRR